MINPYIFREYDIRGVVKDDFSSEVVVSLGKSFGTCVKRLGGNDIALSGDIRDTTPRLMKNFMEGLLQVGINVHDMGIATTPANYFSMFHLKVDGSVQITGSHNPSEFNGFKLSFNKAAFYGKQIQEMKRIIQDDDYEFGQGKVEKVDIMSPYHLMLRSKIKLEKALKAVIDCGNAAACLSAPEIFPSLGIETHELFSTIDASFPNHHPDPTEDHNLIDLIKEVKSGSYDFGVAFDGDADRVVAVDEKGGIIRSDILICLFLPEIIKKSGTPIVFDVKCSQALEDMIIQHGGKPIMWKTGHSLIKDKMKELDVLFGGEMSGHIFFSDDYYGFDDAIYVALRLAQLLSRTNQTLSSLVEKIPIYHSTPEIRLECKNDEEKFMIAKKSFNYFNDNYDCITVDGVRIKYEDGWGLIRASNTQPVIVCRFEATTLDRMEDIKLEIINKLSEFGQLSIGNI